MRRLYVCVWALMLCVLAPAAAGAQNTGQISGTVKDSQDAAAPGVAVEATNTVTTVTSKTVTNESGVYLLSGLPAGKYRLIFTKQGFGIEGREVDVRSAEPLRLDVTLPVGQITQEVRVVAETPLLTAATASRATTFDGGLVENLPINGRNPFMLVLSTAGVNQGGGGGNQASITFRPFDNGGMDRFSANGGVDSANQFQLNGAPNTNGGDFNGNNLSFVPPPEAVEEVNVNTNVYDAQMGRTGGAVVNVTVRSGTNNYRGTASYLGRTKGLSQNTNQNIINGVPKTDLYYYNPVVSFGGPVKLPNYDGNNRTFFFASYEFLKSGQPTGGATRVPTELERAGNFTQSGLQGPLRDPLTGEVFAGNIIPADRIDPVSRALMAYMPLPNITPDSALNNFIASPNSRFDIYNSFLARVDQNMGASRLSVTFGTNGRHEDRANGGRDNVATTGDGHHRRWNDNLSMDLTTSFGTSLVSSFKAGWSHHTRRDNNLDPQDSFDSASLGFTPGYLGLTPRTDFFHPITIDGYGGAGLGGAGNGFHTIDHLFSFSETLTKVAGAHQVKIGAELGINTDRQQLIAQGASYGAFNFTRNFTSTTPSVNNPAASAGGNQFASFLLGYPASGNISLAKSDYLDWSGNYIAAFIQDDWRVNERLTLNLGLRYDIESPVKEKNNLVVSGFDASATNPLSASYSGTLPPGINGRCTACVTLAQDPNIANNRADGGAGLANLIGGPLFADGTGGKVYNRDVNNIGPRFGATYRLSDKMLMRGGWGRTFLNALTDRPPQLNNTRQTSLVTSENNNVTPRVRISETALNGSSSSGPLLYPNGLLQPFGTAQGLATGTGGNISFHNPDKENQEFDQYSIGMQYQLPWRSVVDVSYVGSETNKRPINRQINDLTAAQLALGDAFLDATVPNPFLGLGTNFNGNTIARRQLLRPYPEFANIQLQQIPEGKQWYNALQVSWDKRMSNGVALTANYTFSESWETVDPLNQGEPRYEQLTSLHRPHVVRLTGSWELPRLDGHNAAVRNVAGGWSLGAVATFRSGVLVNMPDNVDIIGNYEIDNPTLGRWFNTCTLSADGVTRNACADPGVDERTADPGRAPLEPAWRVRPNNALDTTGARMDNVRVSSPPNLDMNFIKTFALSQRMNAQVRFEVYNITGAVLYNSPTTSINNFNTFGTVGNNQQNDPRFVMMNFRLQY